MGYLELVYNVPFDSFGQIRHRKFVELVGAFFVIQKCFLVYLFIFSFLHAFFLLIKQIRTMTSFGWKRKAGEKICVTKSKAFETEAKDEDDVPEIKYVYHFGYN